MHLNEFTETMNAWGRLQIPFLFIVDFELENPLVFKLSDIDNRMIRFNINGFTNVPGAAYNGEGKLRPEMQKYPVPIEEYAAKFKIVYDHLQRGDSYLTNLTLKTKIGLQYSLQEIFERSPAKYKLLLNGEVLVFSPETFVKIEAGRIQAYPMKGTIDAATPSAAEIILNDQKELAEHVTIVDLIRNDLSRVSSKVSVTRFRYIDEIITNNKNLLQVSSEISGILAPDYTTQLGNILVNLLPAGSVSGAPKTKTTEIIRKAEGEKRGLYTGVFGYFDGRKLDSGVMIRFIEKQGVDFFYRSGGGITTQSSCASEYQELIDKVYVPVD